MSEPQVLILAPRGRDAEVAATLLLEVGLTSIVCRDVPCLAKRIDEGACFAVVTEEALRSVDLRSLSTGLAAQPPWSDFQFIVLTQRGGGPERNPAAARLLEVLRNVSFLERPFHPTSFLSLARTAARGRHRQFEARARIAELRRGEERLRRLNETLETRVLERTAELEAAHRAVMAEVEQRERAEALLRQSQKMEAIGQLTGGVAHDFNNLLMAVLGNLDLLRKHVSDDPRAARLIEGAQQGAKRGAALTQRLLAFARRQDLVVEPRNLSDLLSGMTDLLERSLGSGVALRLVLPDAPPVAMVDANQLELAVLNLAVNARDAMPNGGELTIEIDGASIGSNSDDALAPGPYVRLTVIDTGQGMDADTLKRAAEPFFSTKGIGKGTGLGLSMIHGLAVQLHGALRLTSVPGRGTRAELWLPKAEAGLPASQAAPAVTEPHEIGESVRARILAVDDDMLIAMSTVDMLEDLGHEVVEASSGPQALDILRRDGPFDLMITDFSMPRMNGAELAEAALALCPGMPILLATGYAELPSGERLNLPRLGKPYSQDQLAAEIRRLLTD